MKVALRILTTSILSVILILVQVISIDGKGGVFTGDYESLDYPYQESFVEVVNHLKIGKHNTTLIRDASVLQAIVAYKLINQQSTGRERELVDKIESKEYKDAAEEILKVDVNESEEARRSAVLAMSGFNSFVTLVIAVLMALSIVQLVVSVILSFWIVRLVEYVYKKKRGVKIE